MGIEDITAFFHEGIAASCERSVLTRRGIRTCLERDTQGRLSISYIQGVARIAPGFTHVAAMESGKRSIVLRSEEGERVEVPCHLEFLRQGTLPGLNLP